MNMALNVWNIIQTEATVNDWWYLESEICSSEDCSSKEYLLSVCTSDERMITRLNAIPITGIS
jgi:hypothetical protein